MASNVFPSLPADDRLDGSMSYCEASAQLSVGELSSLVERSDLQDACLGQFGLTGLFPTAVFAILDGLDYMARRAQNLALGKFSLTASWRPIPDGVMHLGSGINVVEFQGLDRAAADASLPSEVSSSTERPLRIPDRVFRWHLEYSTT